MTSRLRRRRVEPTDEWEQIELLRGGPSSGTTSSSARWSCSASSGQEGPGNRGSLRTHAAEEVARFDAEGMDSLFGSEAGSAEGSRPQ